MAELPEWIRKLQAAQNAPVFRTDEAAVRAAIEPQPVVAPAPWVAPAPAPAAPGVRTIKVDGAEYRSAARAIGTVRQPGLVDTGGLILRETITAAKDGTEEARGAFNAGQSVGEAIASPLARTEKKDDSLAKGLKLALGPTIGGKLRDEIDQGIEIAFSKKDYLGREHPNHLRALGANLAAGATFTTGLLLGVTGEVGKGAGGYFIDPAKLAAENALDNIRNGEQPRGPYLTADEQVRRAQMKDSPKLPALPNLVKPDLVAPVLPLPLAATVAPAPSVHEEKAPKLHHPLPSVVQPVADEPDAEDDERAPEPTLPHAAPTLAPALQPIPVAQEYPPMNPFEKLKQEVQQSAGDLRQAAVALGATRTPMAGPALPTLTTPADSVVGNVAPSGFSLPSLPAPAVAALATAAAGAAIAGGVALARRRSAKKKAAAKKKATKKASRKASKAPARTSKGAKKAKVKRAAKKGARRASDAGGVIPKTWRGQQVYLTKNGRPYVIRKRAEGKLRAGTAKFIPV